MISMTFLTVPDAMYAPMVERESTDTMMPSLNLKARVVVPLANLRVWARSDAPLADAKFWRQKCAGCVLCIQYCVLRYGEGIVLCV